VTLSEISSLKCDSQVNSLGFSLFNDNLLAGALEDGSITFFDLETRKLLSIVQDH
jgi:WD40 repeat protein